MNEVSSTEHGDYQQDLWNLNTFGFSTNYGNYENTESELHSVTAGQDLLASLGLDTDELPPNGPMMAKEVPKLGDSQTHEADIPTATTENTDGARASELATIESQEHAPENMASLESNQKRSPPTTQGQQPGALTTMPHHTDQWSDDTKAHHQPNASPPQYPRQQLNQPNRRESRLREEYTPGEPEALPAPKHSAQSYNQVHSHGSFMQNHPQANPAPLNAIRGFHGLPYPQNQHGFHDPGHAYPSHHNPRPQGYHEPRRSSYQSVSGSSPPHSSTLPRLPPGSYYGSLNNNTDRSPQHMNTLSRPVMQHFEPYGQSFDTHRELAQQGHNYLKQEDSSPRSMASVPSAVGYGSDTNLPPDQRTLQDLEPNPTFDDYEDQGRINRIYGAMMDMTSAQDNGGMKKTWIALSKDKNKVRGVCMKVLNACYVSQNSSSPLQQSVKPQHNYDLLDDRIAAVCQAFKMQKTMCKHLMEAPYLYQVVDDPNLAALRVVNNRKVNKGKKEAIEQGRKALKERVRGGGSTYSARSDEFDDEFQDEGLEDADYDEDEDTFPSPRTLPTYRPQAPAHGNAKRGRQTTTRQMSSDDSADASYGHPPPKKAKKSGSMYQLNGDNQMVDTSENQSPNRKARRVQPPPIARLTTQNRRLSQSLQQGNQAGYAGYQTEFETDNNTETGFSEGSEEYHPGSEYH